MSYKNAAQVLPPKLLREVQKYIDGDFLYIPRAEHHRCEWGSKTAARQEMRDRNRRIYEDYLSGTKAAELAEKYFLSKKSIERIITHYKKEDEH